jgi:hypothetical protein
MYLIYNTQGCCWQNATLNSYSSMHIWLAASIARQNVHSALSRLCQFKDLPLWVQSAHKMNSEMSVLSIPEFRCVFPPKRILDVEAVS